LFKFELTAFGQGWAGGDHPVAAPFLGFIQGLIGLPRREAPVPGSFSGDLALRIFKIASPEQRKNAVWTTAFKRKVGVLSDGIA
jgi:hypothetical protein